MTIRGPAAVIGVTLGLLIVSGLTACIPLPISHTEQVTPRVVGTIQGDDGAGRGDMRIAAAETPDPGSCQWSASTALTDAAGRFALPPVRVRKKIFWLSMMETFGRTAYWICAAPGSTGDSTKPLLARVVGHIAGDSISCLEWQPPGTQELTCDSDHDRHIVSGGEWRDGSAHGTYRLIITIVDTTPYPEYRAFVQWLELSPDTPLHAVRATVELPAPAIDLNPFPAFEERDGAWTVVVKSNRPGMKGADRFMTFTLGKPGVLTLRPNA
jgi:hypothetical protein